MRAEHFWALAVSYEQESQTVSGAVVAPESTNFVPKEFDCQAENSLIMCQFRRNASTVCKHTWLGT